MKKVLLSVAFIVALNIAANAQFSLGIKGGVNYSEIKNDNLNSSNVAGYQAGLFARIGDAVYLQPELYVSSSGGHFQSSDNTYSGEVHFTKLNVPLLVGLKFGSKDLNFRVMAGPVYSYALNTDDNYSQNFILAYNDFGHYNNSTLGLQGGFGVDLGALTADLRYEGGLSDVNKNFGQRQNIWALSVGFKLF